MRSLTAMALVGIVAVVEAIPVTPDNIVDKALTQGGLLVVVLLLLIWQRQDAKARADKKDDQITTLVSIAERSAVAAEANVGASRSNADATRDNTAALSRLATAVERIDRTSPRP